MAKSAEILVYGPIGSMYADFGVRGAVDAAGFAAALSDLGLGAGDELTVRINSDGGDVFDGLAIYNQLLLARRAGVHITARVEGLAASSAATIAMGADEVEIAEAAQMMIHRAWGGTIGNADDHLMTASTLEKDDEVIAGVYARRAGMEPAAAFELMKAETWMTGPQAVAQKFADRLMSEPMRGARAEARRRVEYRLLNRYQRVPETLKAASAVARPMGAGQVLNAANKARCEEIRRLAQELLDSAGTASSMRAEAVEGEREVSEQENADRAMQYDMDMVELALAEQEIKRWT